MGLRGDELYPQSLPKTLPILQGGIMKKNPGRKERRRWFFATRREAGKKRAKLHSSYWHKKSMKGEI